MQTLTDEEAVKLAEWVGFELIPFKECNTHNFWALQSKGFGFIKEDLHVWLSSDEGERALMDRLGNEYPLWRLETINDKDRWIFRIKDWYRDATLSKDFEGTGPTRIAALQRAILGAIGGG